MVTIIVTRMDYGNLISLLTAPLGCLMPWRRMSFADTMAHGTLLGVAIAGALSLPSGLAWQVQLFY